MANIPKSLNIGGHQTIIRVGYKDEVMNRLGLRGEFDTQEWTIDIQGAMINETWQLQTLAHEIMHAFFTAACLELEKDMEEKICHGLENQFYRFLADNDLSFFRPVPQLAQG